MLSPSFATVCCCGLYEQRAQEQHWCSTASAATRGVPALRARSLTGEVSFQSRARNPPALPARRQFPGPVGNLQAQLLLIQPRGSFTDGHQGQPAKRLLWVCKDSRREREAMCLFRLFLVLILNVPLPSDVQAQSGCPLIRMPSDVQAQWVSIT